MAQHRIIDEHSSIYQKENSTKASNTFILQEIGYRIVYANHEQIHGNYSR